MGPYRGHKLLIANRGEIAVRIIRTAKRIGLRTVAIYTPSDSLSPHVLLADESTLLTEAPEAAAYLSVSNILTVCKERSVTLIHPGYGFLSENAEFAKQVIESGITWLGPRPDVIRLMGIKHRARNAAVEAGLEVVPGSEGLVTTDNEALEVAGRCGFPVLLKATAGGGGMGMTICHDEDGLRKALTITKDRSKALFKNDGVFMEKYFDTARHIEVQIFGNGLGDVVHMRERECSVQRRHQKVIEESPSPFCTSHPGLSDAMCQVAVALAASVKYSSAGTIEFLVDEKTAKFYFLEMNTRIQVEHPVTEQIHPGLDIVELMIKQGIAESSNLLGLSPASPEMQQSTYDQLLVRGIAQEVSHSIEGRIYAENPYKDFVPSPGLLQYVNLETKYPWLRLDSWVETGMTITPFFDPLLAKIIVTGSSRNEAISRFILALESVGVSGPPNNVEYLKEIADSIKFREGLANTRFLESFEVTPRAFEVLTSGIDITIQDLPGRTVGLGIPRSGPMDSLSFAIGNILVGNPRTTEGLEIVVVPGVGCSFIFCVPTVVAVTGMDVILKLNGHIVPMWSRIIVPQGGKIEIEAKDISNSTTGFRVYFSISGGFPDVPVYLGSKSTSMGLGGYQGRSLMKGDQISIGNCSPMLGDSIKTLSLPEQFIPPYPSDWTVYVLPGPHDDEEFVTSEGIRKFYSTRWRISPSSNRLGIRLEAPTSEEKIQWARDSGGEGGSHPSNILDNGYAPATVNINGDTPVILTNEGPDMGGYLCMCTVATSDMWKLGQLAPGNTVQFRRVTRTKALEQLSLQEEWLKIVEVSVRALLSGKSPKADPFPLLNSLQEDIPLSPILDILETPKNKPELRVVLRQAGDSAILVEFGEMSLDIVVRARIHAFQNIVYSKKINGILSLSPCIRSILCFYDPRIISGDRFLQILIESARKIPEDTNLMKFPGRKITFPIVLDDKWNREALERYMSTTREKAVYLPSNIEYLSRNNGLSGAVEALEKLVASDWLVFGVGFYLACPFLVPIDPRCSLIGQKMNPSRTFTPRGAIGIAGPVAAIYPIESPGGYQLYGRTLPAWQTWGKGSNFHPQKPWLLEAFDQVRFKPISEKEYIELEKRFDSGQYTFEVEDVIFSMKDHSEFILSIKKDLEAFRANRATASAREAARERELLQEWEDEKQKSKQSAPFMVASGIEDDIKLTSPLFSTVWKIKCAPGDVIESGAQTLIILEAMKTEIPVPAGEGNVGKRVRGLGEHVAEGSAVRPGDILVILE